MAERTGLEPATPGVTGRYSNQLNYRSKLLNCLPDAMNCHPDWHTSLLLDDADILASPRGFEPLYSP
ncbi:protein of unknown function [Pararobbsia alpina]